MSPIRSPIRPVEHWTFEDWSAVLTTNVVGASQITATCLPYLSTDAIVAYLSSDSAFKPRHSLVPYAASKAALEMTIQGWRLEHPERRFVKVIVGPTAGTDFATNFDGESIHVALPSWLAHGDVQMTHDARRLGRCTDFVVGVGPRTPRDRHARNYHSDPRDDSHSHPTTEWRNCKHLEVGCAFLTWPAAISETFIAPKVATRPCCKLRGRNLSDSDQTPPGPRGWWPTRKKRTSIGLSPVKRLATRTTGLHWWPIVISSCNVAPGAPNHSPRLTRK
jgi:short chain dehydrogenase